MLYGFYEHVGLVLGSTSGFDHNYIMHSSAHYQKSAAITVSKKDPYIYIFLCNANFMKLDNIRVT